MKEYEVPEGLHKAAMKAWAEGRPESSVGDCLREIELAVIRWISENPRVPTDTQAHNLWVLETADMTEQDHARAIAVEWQRICWLKPEPEVPEGLDDLLWDSKPSSFNAMPDATHNRQIIEAFRRGQKSVR